MPLQAVSTVGAGDNFNAGLIYGLLKYDIGREQLADMDEANWDRLVQCGMAFAADVCQSLNNSVSPQFAEAYKSRK